MYKHNTRRLITFTGADQVAALRRALVYWHRRRRPAGVSLQHFLSRCRRGVDGPVILYIADEA